MSTRFVNADYVRLKTKVTHLLLCLMDAFFNLSPKFLRVLADDNTHSKFRSLRQCSGRQVNPVVQFLCSLKDPAACFWTYTSSSIQGSVYSGN